MTKQVDLENKTTIVPLRIQKVTCCILYNCNVQSGSPKVLAHSQESGGGHSKLKLLI